MSDHADKTANPLSSPQTQSQGQLPGSEAPLERANPRTEKVDKVITPTSIKHKEREAEALEEKLSDVEHDIRKP